MIARAPGQTMPGQATSDWIYPARDSRHLITVLKGKLVFDVGDGKLLHIKPGEACPRLDRQGGIVRAASASKSAVEWR